MLNVAIVVSLVLVGSALLLGLWRLVRGPGACDRVLALDTLYINTAGLVVIHGIWAGSTLLFEIAMLIAVLGFVGTVALARYIERGRIVE